MHKKFLPLLADPETGEPLELTVDKAEADIVIEGTLKSPSNQYLITQGIPRFVDPQGENYSKNFGYQWNRWKRVQFEDANQGGPMEGYTTDMWERITACEDDLAGQTILDMGCGAGRFTDVARSKGASVIAIDYSSAVDATAENLNNDPNVCICQADALRLPIRDHVLDGAFTIGVLHHTPDPKKGVLEAARVLKHGGWFGLSVYARGGGYDARVRNLWRKLFNWLWPVFGPRPPLWYSYATIYGLWPLHKIPVVGQITRMIFPCAFYLPDHRWKLLDTFDSVTPSYQSTHITHEVFKWFKSAGFSQIEPTPWGSTSFRGTGSG